MGFLTSIIGFVIIILLLRLLITPREAFFNPFYGIVYRITDPILIPAGYVTRSATYGTLLTILALVVLRGGVCLVDPVRLMWNGIYVPIRANSFLSGIEISLLSFVQFLFKAYMAMWFISILSQHSFGGSFTSLIERAFRPLDGVLKQLGIPRRNSHLFLFLFLLILYTLLSTLLRFSMVPTGFSSAVLLQRFGEGLLLLVSLFTGFFLIVIIVGALLSWVSPDPSNPIVQAIYGISEPLLRPFRRFVPLLGGIDFSPMIAIFCFWGIGGLAQRIIVPLMISR
jgi:YggT family protein